MSFRLGVLEDENLTRLTMITALRSLGHEVLVEGANAAKFLQGAQSNHLDAVLLDLHLGAGPTGLDIWLDSATAGTDSPVTASRTAPMIANDFLKNPTTTPNKIHSKRSWVTLSEAQRCSVSPTLVSAKL